MDTIALTQSPTLRFSPPEPRTLAEIDIAQALIQDLILRRLYRDGGGSLASLSQKLMLSIPIVETIFHDLRQRHLIEVKGMLGDDYRFALTEAGHALANERLEVSEYAGPAPVSLGEFHRAASTQAARLKVNRKSLQKAFSDVVMTDEVFDEVGPAMVSQTSLFIYGPTGTGKTTLAERLLRLYEDVVLVPYAVEVDGQLLIQYDPTIHIKAEGSFPGIDRRWVVCRRPCVTVGGELTSEMLDLRRDAQSGIYMAPLQMKAVNGMLIIDDFGRQAISPTRLLNRWIVPLDRRIDYLTLHYGVKFDIPFELMVVFSTNLNPHQLADEAFLRRIRNKIFLGALDPKEFDEILDRQLEKLGLDAVPNAGEVMRELCIRLGTGELKACYPRDLCEIIVATGQYEETELRVNHDTLERAAKLYFTKRLGTTDEGFSGLSEHQS